MSSVDGAAASVLAAKDSAVMSQIAYALQAKSLDVAKQQGQAAVELVEQAAQLGKSHDTGRGFDAIG